MTERLTYHDLDRDELLALLEMRPILTSQSDLLWAKWEVASNRSMKAFDAYMNAGDEATRAFNAYMANRNSRSLAAHENALAKEKRLKGQHNRFRRLADDLYQRHAKAVEARL